MTAELTTSTDDHVPQLRLDLELALNRLRQREEALIVLNRRLLNLERVSGGGLTGPAASVIAERDALVADNTALTDECDALVAQNTALTDERDALAAQNTALTDERDALAAQNIALTDQNEFLTREVELTRNTKLFRYAAPFRRLYATARQVQ